MALEALEKALGVSEKTSRARARSPPIRRPPDYINKPAYSRSSASAAHIDDDDDDAAADDDDDDDDGDDDGDDNDDDDDDTD